MLAEWSGPRSHAFLLTSSTCMGRHPQPRPALMTPTGWLARMTASHMHGVLLAGGTRDAAAGTPGQLCH